jgi:hypothetical protein
MTVQATAKTGESVRIRSQRTEVRLEARLAISTLKQARTLSNADDCI